MILIAGRSMALLTPTANAQEAAPPTAEELAAITERGRMLYEYDQAAWHASDAVAAANPKTVEGQRYIAKKENGKWKVVFGRLNDDRTRFGITYEADEQATLREFEVREDPEKRQDKGFFLFAARAIELATNDFAAGNRPYNAAVLPAAEQLYVYLYPSQAKARVYPLGGDVRYLVSADGGEILEKRPMHKAIIENEPAKRRKKAAVGHHTHAVGDQPEDTDVFHVLTQDPPVPEMVLTAHFVYQVKADGTIEVEKTTKRKN
jgi:hypothetical protein